MSDEVRKKVLARMESIIGNSCYNGNIQNWGPNGEWYGEGRSFRYPITFIDNGKVKDKCYGINTNMPLNRMRSGYYAFGANQLYIISALESVLEYLETEYGLEIQEDL